MRYVLVGVSKYCISFTLAPLGYHPEILRELETESRVSSLLCIWFYRNYTYSCLFGDAFCILRVFAQKYQIYFSVNNGQTTKLSYPPKPNPMLNKQAIGLCNNRTSPITQLHHPVQVAPSLFRRTSQLVVSLVETTCSSP